MYVLCRGCCSIGNEFFLRCRGCCRSLRRRWQSRMPRDSEVAGGVEYGFEDQPNGDSDLTLKEVTVCKDTQNKGNMRRERRLELGDGRGWESGTWGWFSSWIGNLQISMPGSAHCCSLAVSRLSRSHTQPDTWIPLESQTSHSNSVRIHDQVARTPVDSSQSSSTMSSQSRAIHLHYVVPTAFQVMTL